MAYRARSKTNVQVRKDGGAFNIESSERVMKLERMISLVGAAEGKSKGEVLADALEAYLPAKWAAIMKEYSNE